MRSEIFVEVSIDMKPSVKFASSETAAGDTKLIFRHSITQTWNNFFGYWPGEASDVSKIAFKAQRQLEYPRHHTQAFHKKSGFFHPKMVANRQKRFELKQGFVNFLDSILYSQEFRLMVLFEPHHCQYQCGRKLGKHHNASKQQALENPLEMVINQTVLDGVSSRPTSRDMIQFIAYVKCQRVSQAQQRLKILAIVKRTNFLPRQSGMRSQYTYTPHHTTQSLNLRVAESTGQRKLGSIRMKPATQTLVTSDVFAFYKQFSCPGA